MDLEAVGVVSKEDAMRVVVAVLVLEVDAAAIGVGVGTTMTIRVVAEVAVALGAVAVALGAVIEVVSIRVENLGAEIMIVTNQENRGEIMRAVTEAVLRVVLIKENLSISRHRLKIKKSLLTINIK